jgi:hypothetical protein|tara:strand:- start:1239 stop:1457 length:219 start_codon:yes stop_codon:yes gene_type:complete
MANGGNDNYRKKAVRNFRKGFLQTVGLGKVLPGAAGYSAGRKAGAAAAGAAAAMNYDSIPFRNKSIDKLTKK